MFYIQKMLQFSKKKKILNSTTVFYIDNTVSWADNQH